MVFSGKLHVQGTDGRMLQADRRAAKSRK